MPMFVTPQPRDSVRQTGSPVLSYVMSIPATHPSSTATSELESQADALLAGDQPEPVDVEHHHAGR